VQDRFRNSGLFPGKEKMPVEERLFNHVVQEFNLESKYAKKCIEDNRHNHITACYHLIDKRNRKLKDRQDSYQAQKSDFVNKMKMSVAPKDNKAHSPKPVDLNKTAPVRTEPARGRKIGNETPESP
jgi:hypothetical protein